MDIELQILEEYIDSELKNQKTVTFEFPNSKTIECNSNELSYVVKFDNTVPGFITFIQNNDSAKILMKTKDIISIKSSKFISDEEQASVTSQLFG